MSSFLSDLGGLTGGAGAEALAFAAGFAAARALEPAGVTIAQDAWSGATVRRLDAGAAAEAAADGIMSPDDAASEATYSGYERSRFDTLYNVALTGPGLGDLLTMLRHGTATPDDFAHGLRKLRLEPRWDTAARELQTVRLSPAQLALGIVRSTVHDPGLLAVTLDTSDSNVDRYPVWKGDVEAETLAGGVDLDRLRVLVGSVGLPMSAQQAASAYFRGIITRGAFNQAILEGDTRPEWAPFILDQARAILSPTDYVAARLRAWIDTQAMHDGAALHGMSAADADTLLLIHGRPLSWHQVFVGLRRGGVYDGPTDEIDPAFLKALQESDIRPEWYNLAWAQRFAYPSTFVLRAMTEAGDISQAETEQILLYEAWEPNLAKLVSERWAGSVGAAADPNVKKAQTQLWTALHKAYIEDEIADDAAGPVLAAAGVLDTAHTQVLDTWKAERSLVRSRLSATQIRKAIGQPGKDHAWALARLLELGYDQADAETFLAE